jgi:hypothetical protein
MDPGYLSESQKHHLPKIVSVGQGRFDYGGEKIEIPALRDMAKKSQLLIDTKRERSLKTKHGKPRSKRDTDIRLGRFMGLTLVERELVNQKSATTKETELMLRFWDKSIASVKGPGVCLKKNTPKEWPGDTQKEAAGKSEIPYSQRPATSSNNISTTTSSNNMVNQRKGQSLASRQPPQKGKADQSRSSGKGGKSSSDWSSWSGKNRKSGKGKNDGKW